MARTTTFGQRARDAWREFKEGPEHSPRAFPLLPRRKSLSEKLHDCFIALITLAGLGWLLSRLVLYAVG
jgi:hypothetical protein